jgi:transcriptional regulator with XRE-family HTH domain
LARCSGLDPGYLRRIELGIGHPSLDSLVAISSCLGRDLGLRLFETDGPRIHDRFQAPIVEALIRLMGDEWRSHPEVPVPAARGVIDLVLARATDSLQIACECHSELRRLELVLRRSAEKTIALRGQLEAPGDVSAMLLLRSTAATRAIARSYEATLTVAFPARTPEALAALRGNAAWPGPAIVWANVERGRGEILEGPPRGVRVGR